MKLVEIARKFERWRLRSLRGGESEVQEVEIVRLKRFERQRLRCEIEVNVISLRERTCHRDLLYVCHQRNLAKGGLGR